MVGCDLSYGIETGNGKTATGNTSIVENFLPAYRTFKIYPLRSNTTYWYEQGLSFIGFIVWKS